MFKQTKKNVIITGALLGVVSLGVVVFKLVSKYKYGPRRVTKCSKILPNDPLPIPFIDHSQIDLPNAVIIAQAIEQQTKPMSMAKVHRLVRAGVPARPMPRSSESFQPDELPQTFNVPDNVGPARGSSVHTCALPPRMELTEALKIEPDSNHDKIMLYVQPPLADSPLSYIQYDYYYYDDPTLELKDRATVALSLLRELLGPAIYEDQAKHATQLQLTLAALTNLIALPFSVKGFIPMIIGFAASNLLKFVTRKRGFLNRAFRYVIGYPQMRKRRLLTTRVNSALAAHFASICWRSFENVFVLSQASYYPLAATSSIVTTLLMGKCLSEARQRIATDTEFHIHSNEISDIAAAAFLIFCKGTRRRPLFHPFNILDTVETPENNNPAFPQPGVGEKVTAWLKQAGFYLNL